MAEIFFGVSVVVEEDFFLKSLGDLERFFLENVVELSVCDEGDEFFCYFFFNFWMFLLFKYDLGYRVRNVYFDEYFIYKYESLF